MAKIITKYDYEARAESSPGVNFDPKKNKADRSLTNQADMDNADINKIMAKYQKTGVIVDDLGNQRQPVYGDFTQVKDYHTQLCAVRNAEKVFNLLTPDIRRRFDNDPQKLIDFLEDKKNDKKAVELGLKDREVLLTAFADDGVTKITPEDRAALDAKKAAAAAQAAAAGAAGAGGSASGTGTGA